jgi:thioredoxin 1
MDVDHNQATPMRYGIRGIPALLLFKGGKVVDQIVGFVPKETIARSVSKVIAAPAVTRA